MMEHGVGACQMELTPAEGKRESDLKEKRNDKNVIQESSIILWAYLLT
jgi:hypothetical protein